jgi:hypothetical protein
METSSLRQTQPTAAAAEAADGKDRGVYAVSVVLSVGLLWAIAMCALHLPLLWPPATVEVSGTVVPAASPVLSGATDKVAGVIRLDGDPRLFVVPARGSPRWPSVASAIAPGENVVLTVDRPGDGSPTAARPAMARVFEVAADGEVVWSQLRLMPGNTRALSFWGSMLGAILLAMAAVKGFDRGRFDADTAIS